MQPRIRCHDCPGKLYTPGTELCENFEVHLKNRSHREKVEERLKRMTGNADVTATTTTDVTAGGGDGEAMFVS